MSRQEGDGEFLTVSNYSFKKDCGEFGRCQQKVGWVKKNTDKTFLFLFLPSLRPALLCVSAAPPSFHTRQQGWCRNNESTPEPGHQGSPLSHPERHTDQVKPSRKYEHRQARCRTAGNNTVNTDHCPDKPLFGASGGSPAAQTARNHGDKAQRCKGTRDVQLWYCLCLHQLVVFLPSDPCLLRSAPQTRPPLVRGSTVWRTYHSYSALLQSSGVSLRGHSSVNRKSRAESHSPSWAWHRVRSSGCNPD